MCEETTKTVEIPCVVETSAGDDGVITTTKEVEPRVTTTIICHEQQCQTQETTVWVPRPTSNNEGEANPHPTVVEPVPTAIVTIECHEDKCTQHQPQGPAETTVYFECQDNQCNQPQPQPQNNGKVTTTIIVPEPTKPAPTEANNNNPVPQQEANQPAPTEANNANPVPQEANNNPAPAEDAKPEGEQAPTTAGQPNQSLEGEYRTAPGPQQQQPLGTLVITIPSAGPSTNPQVLFEGAGTALTIPLMVLALMLVALFV